jgi:transposase
VHPLLATGQESGIDLGLESFATLANGQPIFTPSFYRKKAAGAGKRVVAVNPAFTSQQCSGLGCGALVQKG